MKMVLKIDGIEVMGNAAWASVAYSAAKKIVATKYRAKSFLAEELLKDITAKVGEPWDRRTMGGVIRALSSDGCIRRNGFAAAKTSHGSIKPVWIKVPHWSKK